MTKERERERERERKKKMCGKREKRVKKMEERESSGPPLAPTVGSYHNAVAQWR